MKVIWKYGRLSSISFLKYSIPFWRLPYSIPKFPLHSISFSIPFHTMPWLSILYYYCKFYSNGCSHVENPKAPDFEKIASASGSFSTLSLPTSFMKVLPQKLNHFRFHIPDVDHQPYRNISHNLLYKLVNLDKLVQRQRIYTVKDIFSFAVL